MTEYQQTDASSASVEKYADTAPSVVVFGLIAADLMFQIDAMPMTAEKYIANDASLGIGGGGANAALALQRLGGQAKLAGRTGDDLLGQLVLDKLNLEHVDCRWVHRLSASRSSVSSIYIDSQGERQIVNFRGDVSSSEDKAQTLSFDAAMLDDCQALLVDTRWEAGAVALLRAARARKLPAVLDAEAPTSSEAMSLATHVAFSRQGLREYSGTDAVESALRMAKQHFNGWVCVTDGCHGVYDLHKECLRHTPAYPVNVVDTLGAGDVWHAAFTLQLARGCAESEAMAYANAAAALKCTRHGGAGAAPSHQELASFLAQID